MGGGNVEGENIDIVTVFHHITKVHLIIAFYHPILWDTRQASFADNFDLPFFSLRPPAIAALIGRHEKVSVYISNQFRSQNNFLRHLIPPFSQIISGIC